MDFSTCALGIELGSTRIKAVLINDKHEPIASGSFEWENSLVDGIWTYPMAEVERGVRACFSSLQQDVTDKFGHPLEQVGALGVSGMMHGYLPFDKEWHQLAEFRTWRNTMTGESAEKLTALFDFNIPQRWSIAHLYQAMLNGEAHLKNLSHLTTLAGYIHYRLTGENVLGIGEASGMFPIDSDKNQYDKTMMEKLNQLIHKMGYDFSLEDVLPGVLPAGACGGTLTEEGALFLDETGTFKPGAFVCPPEGDAGTGMTATNSVRVGTGNVSAGTSDFAMVVVDKKLSVHREIDMVTTPSGKPVAMVHCNNCTSDINAWVGLIAAALEKYGVTVDKNKLFTTLFEEAMNGDKDCGGLLSYNYLSGEGVTDLDEGRPVFARMPDAKLSLANFMRAQVMSALSTLKMGLDILTGEEKVKIDKLYGHGGFFKTPLVGQTMLSAAARVPVSVMQTAGEGGPYGMALLSMYAVNKQENETLEDYLDRRVFKDAVSTSVMADTQDIEGFDRYISLYRRALNVEREAVKTMTEE